MGAGVKTHTTKDLLDKVIPMARAAAEAIQRFAEAPVSARRRNGTSSGWTDHHNLFLTESGLAKSILTISLFEDAALFHCHGD
jgi:hypothetical protein